MKLVFRIYALVWLIVVILYLLGWSEFSITLDNKLIIFLVITISISFLISFILKPVKYKMETREPKHTKLITICILLLFFANFIYGGYIPLFGIVSGAYSYESFPGIPTIYPLVITFSVFYYFYLLYMFLSFKNKHFLICALSIAFMQLLMFSRYVLSLFVLGSGGMVLLLKGRKKAFKLRDLFLILVSVLLVCYLFGCLGNIRSGMAWNDCSYIERLGMFTNWPTWLPKQFMWAYSYIISPLANLNYNIIQNNQTSDIARLVVSFIPEFLSKRFFSDLVTTSAEQTLLIRTYFNAQTTFVESYYCMGIAGCYVTYFLLAVYTLVGHYLMRTRRFYNPVILIAFSAFMILSFFYNVFYYTMTSMFILWSILYLLFHNRRHKFRLCNKSCLRLPNK